MDSSISALKKAKKAKAGRKHGVKKSVKKSKKKTLKKSHKKSHKKALKKTHKKSKTNVQLNRYSDELANGDASDDKDLHEEEDVNDDVVDYNGHDHNGYGSRNPTEFHADNHINGLKSLGDGHF